MKREEISEDEWFAMSNFSPRDTGLAQRIWTSVNVNDRHKVPFLRVESPDKNLFPISINEPIEFLEGWPPGLSASDVTALKTFIAVNRETLLLHWNDEFDTMDLVENLRSLNSQGNV